MSATREQVEELVRQVLEGMSLRNTDEVFLRIENDPVLEQQYQDMAERIGDTGTLNQQIGKAVKRLCGLDNADGRIGSPQSGLITSCQPYRLPCVPEEGE